MDSLTERAESQPLATARFWPSVLVAVAIGLVAVIRLRLLQIPLERDEGEYAYAGQLILQGIPPYQIAFNMKFPGTYAAYAAIMAIFGQSVGGIHMGFLLLNAGTIVLVYLLGKRLFSTVAGVAAAAAYAVLSLSTDVLGTQAHATHFVVAAATGGTLLLRRAVDTRRPSTLFWSGVLYGVAILMKQHGALIAAFAVLFLLLSGFRQRPAWLTMLGKMALFCGGTAVPLALAGLTLWKAGVFGKFWFWTITYAREYAAELTVSQGIEVLQTNFPRAVSHNVPVWIAAAAGLVLVWARKEHRSAGMFVTAFLVFSFLAACPGFYFRPHYFVLVLPAVALLAGAAVGSMNELLPAGAVRYGMYGLGGMVLLSPIALQRGFFFQMTPLQASRALYGAQPFPEAIRIGAWIRAHAAKGSSIAVLGSEPEIPFYADRHSATGYMYVYPMMELQPFALTMQEEMIHDLEAARPEYVVMVTHQGSWLRRPESQTLIFDWWRVYRTGRYTRVGLVDIISKDHTEYRWGDVDSYGTPAPGALFVYKRN
jgi:hypothetical protein